MYCIDALWLQEKNRRLRTENQRLERELCDMQASLMAAEAEATRLRVSCRQGACYALWARRFYLCTW